MKQVFAFALGILAICCANAAEDYYRDEKGITYTLGWYGERIYEWQQRKPNEKTESKIDFHGEHDFTNFGWSLFKNANNRQLNNFVLSPTSPQILLGIIRTRCGGDSKAEIQNAIGNTSSKKLTKLITALKDEDSSRQLEVATAIFATEGLKDQFADEYVSGANSRKIDIFYQNFKNQQKFERKYNDWVKIKTNGLLKSESIKVDPNSKMILTSATYFKADWLFAFTNAGLGKFQTDQGDKDVEMISLRFKKFHYGYLSDNNGEWLSVPYNSTDTMLILLPNKTRSIGIDQLIDITPNSDISDIITIISQHQQPNTLVNITMPKFKIDTALNLKDPLQKMGIRKIFSSESEYSPLKDATLKLQVSEATQQSSFEVSETGSIGASVTRYSVTALSVRAPVKAVNFVVDRPFVAVIVNRLYGIPYFIAKVSDVGVLGRHDQKDTSYEGNQRVGNQDTSSEEKLKYPRTNPTPSTPVNPFLSNLTKEKD